MAEKSAEQSKNPKKQARLGRGLSSLMARPVQVDVQEPEPPAPEKTAKTRANEVANTATKSPKSTPGSQNQTKSGMQSGPDSFNTENASAARTDEMPTNGTTSGGVVYLGVAEVSANPNQPRQHFDENALSTLADSIRREGMMQPIIVRPSVHGSPGGGQTYEIVAGERRWRAAKIANLAAVPAIVRELDDRQVAEWALIENLQREDLNPMERAEAFDRLAMNFSLSHDDIAGRVGLNRSTVSNLLRLLTLDDSVQELIRQGALSMGHAKAILPLTDTKQQRAIVKRVVREDWSVRRTEQAVRALLEPASAQPQADASLSRKGYLQDLEQNVGQQLGTKVRIRSGRKKGSGSLTIDFYSLDQFDQLLEKLGVTVE